MFVMRPLMVTARLTVGVVGAFAFLFTAPIVAREDFPESFRWWRDEVERLGGDALQTLVVVAGLGALATAVLWARLVPRRRGPRLVAGEFREFTRNALGGPDLQVLGVEIYNERESGGEPNTARGVVPTLEAFDQDGTLVAECRANWFPDFAGAMPPTVDFRPTREAHPVELAGKFPSGTDAWLAGQTDPPSLKPGTYKIRATFRGDNLREPRRLEFFLHNPGPGRKLAAAKAKPDLPRTAAGVSREAGEEARVPDELDPKRADSKKGTEPPSLDPLEQVETLLAQAPDLERKLWERVREMNRSGSLLPSLGSDYLREVRAWNLKVLSLADAHLPIKDASQVAALAGWSSLYPKASVIEALIHDNSAALRRIHRRLQDQRAV